MTIKSKHGKVDQMVGVGACTAETQDLIFRLSFLVVFSLYFTSADHSLC